MAFAVPIPLRMTRAATTDEFVKQVAGAFTVAEIGWRLTTFLADRLGAPTALLSRTGDRWRFEAEAWPAQIAPVDSHGRVASVPAEAARARWTGIALGAEDTRRGWVLLFPGAPESWDIPPDVSQLLPGIGVLLEDVAAREEIGEGQRFGRRYHRFCRRLLRAQTSDQIHALILRTIGGHLGAQIGVLALWRQEDEHLQIVATRGYPREVVDHVRIRPGEGVIGSVFSTGRSALVADGPADVHRRLRYRTASYIAAPLHGGSGVLGVVAFTDKGDGSPFGHGDLTALRLFASPAALALSNYELRRATDEVTRLASIDPLTGLFNRRHFDSRLEAELQRSRRHGDPLALLMVDVDNFKEINDAHGHVTGDRLLRCVADRLKRGVRIFDVCARYGGDEFAILMPSSNVDTAVLVAERIRTAVSTHCAHPGANLTVSIGIAVSDGREPELLSVADRALLEAKAVGKNVVRVQPSAS